MRTAKETAKWCQCSIKEARRLLKICKINARRRHKKWYPIFQKIKVGDIICTCAWKHLKVAKIEKEYSDNSKYIYDLNLIMENGGHCSFINCCNIPPNCKCGNIYPGIGDVYKEDWERWHQTWSPDIMKGIVDKYRLEFPHS